MPLLLTELQKIMNDKRVRLSTITTIINTLLQQEPDLSIAQKSAIIQTITHSLLLSTKNWLAQLKKLHLEICNTPHSKSNNKKPRSIEPDRVGKIRGKKQTKNLSIDQILDEVMGQNLDFDRIVGPTPKKEPIIADNNFSVTIAPFEPEMIAQMSQDINSALQTMKKTKQQNNFDILPKITSYKKWLALTQQNINIANDKKKTTTRTKKKNDQKLQMITDQKIDVSQGIDRLQQLQILKTKVKLSRKRSDNQGCKFIEKHILQLNPLLSVTPLDIVQKLKQIALLNRNQSTPAKSNFHTENLTNLNYVMEEIDLDGEPYDRSAAIFVNETNDAKLTAQLQTKITDILNAQLFKHPTVSLNKLCQNRNISKQLKGQMFYQLLHLNFKMNQPHIHQFGDILITSD